MFGDDFFGIEDIFNQLTRGKTTFNKNTYSGKEILLNVTSTKSKKFFIFDLSGHNLKSIKIKDNLEINDYGESVSTGEKVLEIKYDEETLKYIIPKNLRTSTLKHKFINGILEVSLEK